MKNFILSIFVVVILLFFMAIAGQFGRDIAKKTIASKEVVEINSITDQYANASRKMTTAITEFAKADQAIINSIEQLERLKDLLEVSKRAFENHEEIRIKGLDYLLSHKNAFKKDFYSDMHFSFGLESIMECNEAYIEFSSNYLKTIDYLISNFDKVLASAEPETTTYNGKLNNCSNLRQKYNEAYLEKLGAMKKRFGAKYINSITKQLHE